MFHCLPLFKVLQYKSKLKPRAIPSDSVQMLQRNIYILRWTTLRYVSNRTKIKSNRCTSTYEKMDIATFWKRPFVHNFSRHQVCHLLYVEKNLCRDFGKCQHNSTCNEPVSRIYKIMSLCHLRHLLPYSNKQFTNNNHPEDPLKYEQH